MCVSRSRRAGSGIGTAVRRQLDVRPSYRNLVDQSSCCNDIAYKAVIAKIFLLVNFVYFEESEEAKYLPQKRRLYVNGYLKLSSG